MRGPRAPRWSPSTRASPPPRPGRTSGSPIRPGTDTALIDAIINYVIQKKLYDAAYLHKYTVAPFLVDPKTSKWLRTGDVGLGGDDYVVVDAAGKIAAAKGARNPQLLGTFTAGALQAPTALQVLADTIAKYTPEYVAAITDIPAADILALAELWARLTRSPCGPASPSRTGTAAT